MRFQAPKGNKFALGGKGGARKSAYAEKQDAEFFDYIWRNDQDITELKAKMDTGVYSARDMLAWQVLTGNERMCAKFLDKMVPDLHDIRSMGKSIVPEPTIEQIQRFVARHASNK